MKKLLALIGPAIAYWCIATVLAQALAVGLLWWKGMLQKDRIVQTLTAAYGFEPMALVGADANKKSVVEFPSADEIIQKRVEASLDLDLREMAIEKALIDLRNMQEQLREERDRYRKLKESFDAQLADLHQDATANALQEVRVTLENLQPKQAKDQIMRMLNEATADDYDNTMRDIVTMVKAMSLDKRKKILGEFKAQPEIDMLQEILGEMLIGTGDAELIEKTREQINDAGAL